MKKLILLFLASSLVFCSCDEFLDEIIGEVLQPDSGLVEGELDVNDFKSEAEIIEAIDSIYISLGEYIEWQNEIEKIYLIDKNFDAITPSNPIIEKAWTAAYSAIEKANRYIRSLERYPESIDYDNVEKYLGICNGLVGFTYKNLLEHWGNIPLITPYTSEMEMPYTANEDEVWHYTNESLERSLYIMERFEFSDSKYISHAALLLATSEARGYRDCNMGYDLCRKYSELYQTDKEIVFELKATNDNILIYTSAHAYYLRCEYTFLMGNWDELGVRDFNTVLKRWDSSRYGYWSMLKRNKKLSEITGCPEYMQYLPIPQKALNENANLMQNPGYIN